MEEITYNDVLVHYQRMMADITDELQQLENSLEKISVFSQQTWKGKAGMPVLRNYRSCVTR